MKKILTIAFLIIASFSYSQETEITINPGSPSQPQKEDIKIYQLKEVEVPARFIDNDAKLNQFITENFVIPKKIKEKKIKGEIVLSFVVEKDGTLTDFKTIKDLGFKSDQELIRVANLTKWYPAELNGKKVRTIFKLTYLVNGSI